MTFLAFLSLAIWIYLLTAHGKFWQAGPILTPATPKNTPTIAILVPARDEAATIAACLQSLLIQEYAGKFRLIMIDDGSSDSTGDIARTLDDPRLTVMAGQNRPAGWSGKLWALAQGIDVANDVEFFLFTDADIVHNPAHLATLMARAERGNLDLVSEMVALSCESLPERALVPAFVFFFQLLYPFERVNDPLLNTAAAAGGTILVRRRALDKIGGIQAIRGTLIDDVSLAKAVKAGGKIWLGHSGLARSLRPYPDVGDIWRMITRTAYTQLRYSPVLLVLTVISMVVIWMLPPLTTIFDDGWARVFGLLAWLGAMASYLPTLRRFGCTPAWALALPLIALFYTAATVASAIAYHRGQGAVWKNRSYGGAA